MWASAGQDRCLSAGSAALFRIPAGQPPLSGPIVTDGEIGRTSREDHDP
jgi:hypothetical protein